MITTLLIATLAALLAFAIVWAICVRVRNYAFLDVAFSYGVGLLAPFYAWRGPAEPLLKWGAAAVGMLWSLRLGTYLFRRVWRHHPHEDRRYQTLRERWPGPAMFLLFFELQALLVVIFSLPFLFIAWDRNPPNGWHLAGLLLALAALGGEAVADAQLQRFKRDPELRRASGDVCQVGLWRYSRHPNYFFESLVQWGFFLAALGSPHGAITLASPLLMLWFLFRVTGIPITEEYALRTKGEAYRRYQQTTSPFIPWFRKTL
jgi:steroid 5-alpha reductase family enzyme